MRALLKILTRESLVSFVALIVLLLLVWFGGEFLHAKYGVFERTTRILVMAVVLGVWFLLYIVQKVFAIRGAMQIEKRLRAQAADQRESVRPDKKPEVEALEKQLNEAIQALKASTFGKEALYALPWYIIVGPPGVGKTTALVESGLSFPYMSQGRRGIRGVGGTRNCDWWFTDQGILLDTAGRYTTELEDRDEWLAFLEMLRKSRKWKPINGAIVAVSVPELLRMTAEDLTTHAKNIRDRIDELTRSLELVFPVYLIFTKCDLLSGFTEFFEGFSKADRAQAWGATLPYGIPPDIGAVFDEEVKKLYAALCTRRVKALSADLPHEKRRQIYSFPLQFAVAEKRLQEFTAAFRSNPYQESSILRGFYFTSGTQEGAPIDQVVAAMSQAFGLKEEAGSFAKQVTEKKSYFLHDLFTKIIFPDQNLARSSTRVQKRARLLGRGIAVGASAAFVIVFILLFLSFSTNYSRISAVSGASTKLKGLSWDSTSALDPKIEALEELKNGLESIERAETSWIAAPWLFNHGRQVSRAARNTLLTRLTSLFAAPSARILAAELKDGLEKPKSAIEDFESLHGLLRAYLTLSGRKVGLSPLELQATLDSGHRWRRALGEATLSEQEAERSDGLLRFYAAQIGRGDLPPVPADKDLVAAVTNDLAGPGWVHAVYQGIVKSSQAGDLLKKVSPDDFLPKDTQQKGLLVCPEAFQVEGIYTKLGYNRWVREAVEGQSRALAAKLETVEEAPHDPQPIREALEKTYAAECERRWLEFLRHIDPRETVNLKDALLFLGQVIHPKTSPYREVIGGIRTFRRIELKHAATPASTAETLGAADGGARPPGGAPPDPKEEWDWLNKTFGAVGVLRETVQRILGSSSDSRQFITLPEELLKELKKAFEDARAAVEKEVQLSDKALEGAAYAALSKLLESTSLAVRKECEKEVDKYWKDSVVTPYREGFAPKYPFNDGATEEVPMAAFSKTFQPEKGVFWTTLENLKRLNRIEIYGSRLTSFSATFQTTVNKATIFKTALYKPDGSAIEVPIEVALEKTASMKDIELRIGKTTFKLLDSPSFRTRLTWSELSDPPGAPPGADLRYVVAVAGREGDTKNCLSFKSEWGALRLFHAGKRNPGVADKFPWEWKCSPENATETVHYDLILIRRDSNPFEPGFFTFDPPERVGS